MNQYQKFLKKYGLPALKEVAGRPEVIQIVERDIPDLGELGLEIISDIGQLKASQFEGCIGCEACIEECPEIALEMQEHGEDFEISINLARCDGVACRRCERSCGEKVFNLIKLITS